MRNGQKNIYIHIFTAIYLYKNYYINVFSILIFFEQNIFIAKNIARLQKSTPSTSYPLLRCQIVLTKRLLSHKKSCCKKILFAKTVHVTNFFVTKNFLFTFFTMSVCLSVCLRQTKTPTFGGPGDLWSMIAFLISV